jgi:hypothetical protein
LRTERKGLKSSLEFELEEVTFLEKTAESLNKTVSKIRSAVNARLFKRGNHRGRDNFLSFRERRVTVTRPAGEQLSVDLQHRKVSGVSHIRGS